MMWSREGYNRRYRRAMTGQQLYPVAHLPFSLGGLRRLEVATRMAPRMPPHPAHGLACGRGVEAWGLALLDGPPARYKGGKRLAERGLVPLLPPGRTRAALTADRLGPILEALCAAHLTQVLRIIALQAFEVSAIPTPWRPPDTTTMRLYGASADEPKHPAAPRPAYG